MSDKSVKITVSVSTDNGDIKIIEHCVPENSVEMFLISTRNEAVAKALVALGWMPPKE